MTSYRYSWWDGSQDLSWLGAEDLMSELSEAMIDHGDLYWALRRLMQSGFGGPLGERLRGIQDMLQQLRRQKQQMLDQYQLDSVMDEFQRRLDEVVRTEREGIGRRLEEARHPSQKGQESQTADGEVEKAVGERDEDLLKALERVAERNLAFLDNLPKDLAGAIRELADYEFMDADARRQFEELMSMLRRQITESLFKDMMQQLQDMGPQELSRLKDMLKSLNQMLQEKMQGGEPDLDRFLKEFGQHFSGQAPSNLDELMDMLQRRMGQMGSLLDSLSSEEKKALEDLMDSILQDQGLRQQLMELAASLEHLRPMGNLRAQHPFEGEEPVDLSQALRLMEELQEMGDLERQLGETRFRSDMDNIDSDKLRRLLGEEAYQSLEQLKHLTDILEEAGYITKRGGRWDLTPLGIRRIGQKALG
ncbi:MAG: VWA domain-containing protein, partial [Dehalococcoidia bacterium]